MSVELNWDILTGGPDGEALAQTIRDFIHERFQAVQLPKLIRSVSVHSFEFGKISPEIVLKDIGDPLPDFYETGEDDAAEDGGDAKGDDGRPQSHSDFRSPKNGAHSRGPDGPRRQPELDVLERLGTSNLARGTTPGVLGATTNLGYFHLPLSGGMPGSQTPLAAVAGAHFPQGQQQPRHRQHTDSFSSQSPVTPASSHDLPYVEHAATPTAGFDLDDTTSPQSQSRPDRSPEDMQVVFHVAYAGDVKLSLTADVFLDYPMPSFVGIPLKLKITGLTFNGIGILAYIKKRAHLCFLNPEDAEALVGGEPDFDALNGDDNDPGSVLKPSKVGALLEDIKIESEMGESDSGRQVLKNVGKIERFILEQVQRIFEDEFVYPSFWTFLV